MEALFSAAVGEVFSRCISFLIKKYPTTMMPGVSKEENPQKLEKALLRVAITVEEAEGRFITNKGMLQQLKMLRKEMYKGYYVLDKFKYLNGEEEKVNAHHQSLSYTSNQSKRPFPPSAVISISTQGKNELKRTLDSVQAMVTDMYEFVAFLSNYPPMFRQPYSMHLLFETCMFGRQAEMERTVHFLLQREPSAPGKLVSVGVLPIIGQGRVGKSTLVEHVCYDVRVRQHFSQIVFFSGNKFVEEKQETLKYIVDGGIVKYKNCSQDDGKLLVIIELDGDVEEGSWRRLLSASRSCLPSGSKIIVTSRSEKVANFGTAQAIRLDFLSREACWYFFKVLLFGSSYAEDQPELASIAMEIFEEYYSQDAFLGDFIGSLATSKNMAALLRSNVSTQHWCRILACIRRNWEENLVPSINGPNNPRVENGHYKVCTISNMYQYVQVDRHHVVRSGHEEVPKITIDEVVYGRIAPKGKFEVLWWTSHLPPYHRYIASCEILDSKCLHEGKRCSKKRKGPMI